MKYEVPGLTYEDQEKIAGELEVPDYKMQLEIRENAAEEYVWIA